MSWVAVAVGGGAVVGAVASNNAADKQVGAANSAVDFQKSMFNTINSQNAPYRSAGQSALSMLEYLTGTLSAPVAPKKQDFYFRPGGGNSSSGLQGDGNFVKLNGHRQSFDPALSKILGGGGGDDGNDAVFDSAGYAEAMKKYESDSANYSPGLGADSPYSLLHRFGADDLNANLAPNWQWALQQGQGATQNLANSSGGLLSGNTLKGISDYTINKSGDLYQNAFSNYTANQTNIFNRLASIAGIGQTANNATGTAATAAGTQVGSSLQNAGAASAAGIVGSANAINGGINNATSWYGLNNLTGGKLFGNNGSGNVNPEQEANISGIA